MVNIGRNERCWCGSGKKFKRCHLDRENVDRLTIGNVLDGQRDAASLRLCLVKNLDTTACSGGIVQAHSLSRKASLERIARKQHVYGFRAWLTELRQSGGRMLPRLVGIREASTFTGFCQGHDGQLFKAIDAHPLVPTPEQIALLSYRTLCREIIWKMVLGRTVPLMRETDRGHSPIRQLRTQLTADEFGNHVADALPDLAGEQAAWHRVVQEGAYDQLSYAVIQLGSTPDVVCGGVSQPDKDFLGRMLIDLRARGARQDDVAFTLIPCDMGGLAIFSWLGHFQEAEAFVGSLLSLPEPRIVNQLVRYAFETFDNVWLSPNWWEGLASPQKEFLIERMNIGGLPYAVGTDDPYTLRDNGMEFVRWPIRHIETTFR